MQSLARAPVALSSPHASRRTATLPCSATVRFPAGVRLAGSSARGDLLTARVFGGGPKKTLKREEEPEEYWTSKGEREGANPMKDPLAIIGVVAIFFPFIVLGIAIAFGLVDLSGGR